jgi:hypothetical protein
MADRILINEGPREIKAYSIRPEREAEFLAFFNEGEKDAAGKPVMANGKAVEGIRKWLGNNNVKNGEAWTVRNGNLRLLLCAIDPLEVDWRLIPNFANYLQGEVDIQSRPELKIP